MKTTSRTALLLTLWLLVGTLLAHGQSIEELNGRIQKAEKEIAKNEKLLKELSASKKSNQTEVKLLQVKIDNRQKVVSSLDKQMRLISKQIESKNGDIKSLRTQLATLEEEYAEMTRVAYKNHLLGTPLHFIFSSEDISTATRRVALLSRYNKALRTRGEEMKQMSQTIENEVTNLSTQQAELDKTKGEHQAALKSLGKEKTELSEAGKRLAANEKKISKELKKRREEKKKAQQTLQKIIDEETRKAKRKMTDEERRAITALNGRFDQNKGKMLMPVNGGVIIERFGKHKHPTQKHITVVNKGVNIAASKGSDVFAVFEGEVARVMFISGLNHCVMLRHGDYFTIYSNLASVTVKAGDHVATNGKIGALSSGDSPDDYQLHFELWFHTVNQDPELWFAD
ncbi:MAG: peptidoglycan DD-metalloendopeptidase family protein [Tidjanibacter sp.]|nr:peptidoglycan DD-metalloendopeptidase family protein [Tidjanibacter sp.]